MAGSVAFASFDSIDAQAEQLVGFDQQYQQLEPGHYSGAFLTHEVADISIAIEQTNRALHQVGAGASGRLSAVLLMDGADQPSRVNGQPFTTDEVLLIPEDSSYEAVVVAGAVPVVVSVPSRSDFIPAPSTHRDDGTVRRTTNSGLAAAFRAFVLAALPTATTPAPAEAAPAIDARTQRAAHALMTRLRCDVSENSPRSHETFRWARSLLVGDIAADVSMTELANAVGVSRRTLDASFHASVGVSPARFRKLLRLNHARRLIEGGHYSVTAAASLSGLHHLGRFSSDYLDLFQELPSATRARASEERPPHRS